MPVNKTFNITLDVSAVLTQEEIRIKQGDTGNIFVITLVDNGSAVDLNNCRVVALFTKGSRLAMQDNWTNDGGVSIGGTDHNVITISLFNGSFVPGLNTCEIQVYSGDDLDTLVTSAAFNFRCARSLMNDDTIITSQDYSVLTSLIATVQEIVNGAQSDWNETDSADSKFIENKPTAFTPSAHAASHGSSGADAVTPVSIGAAAASHAARHGSAGADPITPADIDAAPATHASRHGASGADPVTPASIGAAALNESGRVLPGQACASTLTKTASCTLEQADGGRLLRVDTAEAATVTVPTNAAVAFPLDTEIELCQWGAGGVTIAAAEGVTLVSMDGATALAGQYACAVLKKLAADTWLLAGGIG